MKSPQRLSLVMLFHRLLRKLPVQLVQLAWNHNLPPSLGALARHVAGNTFSSGTIWKNAVRVIAQKLQFITPYTMFIGNVYDQIL